VTELPFLAATRDSYDTVAEDYAELVLPRFAEGVLGRAMLGAFAELVKGDGQQPVADLGCGPGHVTAHLNSLGVPAFGVDLSPRMVALARRTYPELRFEVGTMTALDIEDDHLGGLVAWWSIIHTPPDHLPLLFAEFHRTLAPGAHALLGFHAGDAHLHPTHAYGHPVTYTAYRHPPNHIAALLTHTGFTLTAHLLTEGEKCPQACLLARKADEA
jgi:SAM-dependent methyltransferase